MESAMLAAVWHHCRNFAQLRRPVTPKKLDRHASPQTKLQADAHIAGQRTHKAQNDIKRKQ